MVLYPRSGFGRKIFVLGSIRFNRESIDSRFLHYKLLVAPVVSNETIHVIAHPISQQNVHTLSLIPIVVRLTNVQKKLDQRLM